MIGTSINNYLLERKLGEGGMGEVFFARHNRIDRIVAIKILHKNLFANEIVRNRFKNEANALIKLEHPNIVKIYDYIEQEDFACLIVEYIDGVTLDDFINKYSGPLPEDKTSGIICTVLDAVQYAHDNKILHRDIKPGNIMVSRDGKLVKVMDFGIAKFTDVAAPNVTHMNTHLGTPYYMSPEQVKGLPFSTYSDIYSIGVTLYEMATGKCPYMGVATLFELQSKIVNEPLPPTNLHYPDVSPKLQEAIKHATNKIPEQRFKTCNEFKEFLKKELRIQPADGANERTQVKLQELQKTIVIQEAPNKAGGKKKKSAFWIFLSSIIIIGAIVITFVMNNGSGKANSKQSKEDSTISNNNSKMTQIPVKPDPLISENKADIIILSKEKSTKTLLKEPLGQNTKPSTVITPVTPPDKNVVLSDLKYKRLSNGVLFQDAMSIIDYIPGGFDENNPLSDWSASITFKSNDTTYLARLDYRKGENSYKYISNNSSIISVPAEVVKNSFPTTKEIKEDLRRYLIKHKIICGIKYAGDKGFSDINIIQTKPDGSSNITFDIEFIFKGVTIACSLIYNELYHVNNSQAKYQFLNLKPNCK